MNAPQTLSLPHNNKNLQAEQELLLAAKDPGNTLRACSECPLLPDQPIYQKGDRVPVMRCYGVLQGGCMRVEHMR